MDYVNGFSRHLSRASLNGPAERTIVEPWLSELTRLPLNTYPEEADGQVVALRRDLRPLERRAVA
ncbi:hypothetical protein [Actinomadura rupiterrae]|uniref:hypothetical protein n=1 Tax=Actinomadura rupiterrae TaxID=559627 RepID=UPI0020A5569D|nr:hypothetical protein [Actinomadura rupiterrae]MCP2341943.1 hypothetical protein [Actinomadura rupiterrae]